MTGYCVTGDHLNCRDTKRDSGACSCPCHLTSGIVMIARCPACRMNFHGFGLNATGDAPCYWCKGTGLNNEGDVLQGPVAVKDES